MTTQIASVVPGGGNVSGPARTLYACQGAPVTAVNDVQTITVDSCTHSTLTLSGLPGGISHTFVQDVSTAAMATVLNAILGASSVGVTGTYSAGSGGTYIITASGGNFAGKPLALLAVSATFVGGSSPAVAIVHTTPGISATFGALAPKGSLLIDETNGTLYQNTGTLLVPVWTSAPSGATPSVTTLTVAGLTTLSGPEVLTPNVVAALALDVTLSPVYTKSIATASTFTATTGGTAGQIIILIISTDATQRVATFGTNLNASGTLTIPASKVGTITFISDGTSFREIARAICV